MDRPPLIVPQYDNKVDLHPEILDSLVKLQALLVASATSLAPDEEEYVNLRSPLLENPITAALLPGPVKRAQSHRDFLTWLTKKFPQHGGRISFLNKAFLETIELTTVRAGRPTDAEISLTLESFDIDGVSKVWQKALDRCCRLEDFGGAITAARTLLEAVCRRILKDGGNHVSDGQNLPTLYSQVTKVLRLSPDHTTDNELKRVLGGCQNIVSGLGALRNRLGDAHASSNADRYQAELAVQLAGAMACYLVATWHQHLRGQSASATD